MTKEEFEKRAERLLEDEEAIQNWKDEEYRDVMYFLYQMHEERNWDPANIDNHIRYVLETDVEDLYQMNRYAKKFANQRVIEELESFVFSDKGWVHEVIEINDVIKRIKELNEKP